MPRYAPLLFMLALTLVACDSGESSDEPEIETNASVNVAGIGSYTFGEPAVATIEEVAGATTSVLSIRLEEETAEGRIGLQIDLEAEELAADSVYRGLFNSIGRGHIGNGESGMWARFFDCSDRPGPCERDYYATSAQDFLFFIQLTALDDERVGGSVAFQGFNTGGPTARVQAQFALPVER